MLKSKYCCTFARIINGLQTTIMKNIFFTVLALGIALSLSAQRVYINPGHGTEPNIDVDVKWELNGGHISENKLLWEDFQNYFNEYYGTSYAHQPINDILTFWSKGNDGSCSILVADPAKDPSDYWWLGHYLYNKVSPHTNPGSGNEYIWWGNLLNAFLNCTTYDFYCYNCSTNVTVDFTEAGKYDSWKNSATEEIRQKVTLPNQITSDYTIPTPEKEGATFQGWYDNPNGTGTALTTLPAGYVGTIYAIWVGPVPCIVAYDLNCKYKVGAMAFDFSFYANTQPTSGQLIFYNKDGVKTKVFELTNLRQGKNTVFIQAQDIPEYENGFTVGKDILWEVHLEARPSTLFADIFHSDAFNTAYATIDNSPESDFFGSIWVASQHEHGYNTTTDGEIYRLVPEQGYARDGEKDATQGHRPHRPRPGDSKPNGGGGQPPRWDGQQPPQGGGGQPQGGGGQPQPNGSGQQPPQGGKQEPPRGGRPDHTPSENTENGFEVIFRPTVAPDGKVYLTDNGPSYGGVFVMDPHTKHITNFFDGYEYANGEWKDNSGNVVGSGSTGAHIYWTENEAKLYLIHNTHPNAANDAGQALGFFKYDLMKNGELQHTYNNTMAYKAFAMEYRGTLTDYAIVGSSHGIWVCNLRIDNVYLDPSLSFYSNDGMVTYFEDPDFISGSWGAALAVNHDETILVMVDKDGDLLQFDINWSEDVPSLTNKQVHQIFDFTSNDNYDRPTITTLNFDYAGNLVATLGETYNDSIDQHEVVIFTLPKTPNHIDVPSRYSQRVPSLVEDDQCNSIAEVNTTYETVDIYRNLQAGMYNTICLPFDIDLNNLSEDHPYKKASVVQFVGTDIQTVGGEDMLELQFSPVTFMQAGVPYLIQPQQDIKEPVRVSGVSTNENIGGMSIERGAATFHGITSPTTIAKNPNILFLVANNRLATATVNGPMLGNRAYFELHAQNLPKRSMISIVKSTPAGFEEISNTYQTEAYKMLYNGMIVIVRDGVMHDLMGTRIK